MECCKTGHPAPGLDPPLPDDERRTTTRRAARRLCRAQFCETPRPVLAIPVKRRRGRAEHSAVTSRTTADGVRLALAGEWTVDAGAQLRRAGCARRRRALGDDRSRASRSHGHGGGVGSRSLAPVAGRAPRRGRPCISTARPEHATCARRPFPPDGGPSVARAANLVVARPQRSAKACRGRRSGISAPHGVGATGSTEPAEHSTEHATIFHLKSFSLAAPGSCSYKLLRAVHRASLVGAKLEHETAFTVDLMCCANWACCWASIINSC